MAREPLYEQLWDISYEFLKKNCSIAAVLTSRLMIDRAEYLRSRLLAPDAVGSKSFASDFKDAHEELQNMGKSVQEFVGSWQNLFTTAVSTIESGTISESRDLKFDFIKPSLEYEKSQIVKLLVTDIPKTTAEVFCAIDQQKRSNLNHLSDLQVTPKSILSDLPPAGKVFAIMLENIWFRAVRNGLGHTDDMDTVAICLLDTGEVLPYQTSHIIAELPKTFQTIPACFFKCRIVSDNNLASFQRYDVFSCQVIRVEGDTLMVQPISDNKAKKAMQNDDRAHNEQTKTEPATSHETLPVSQYAITRATLSEKELKQLDELPDSTTNAMKAVVGYVPKDDEQICKFYNPHIKGCFKGSNCRRRHIEKDPEGWTLDRNKVSVSTAAIMEIPAPNTVVTLQPTMVIDTELFYSQIVPAEGYNIAFSEQSAEMNDPETVAQYKKLKLFPTIGELVLAKYDSIWYRAQVCEIFDRTVSVFYVDYGNVETLPIDELRMCSDRFKGLPCQAVSCRLANARHVKPYHLEAIEQLTNTILDKQLKALILDNKTPWEVQLFDEDGFDIGQGLIMTKLALPREPTTTDDSSRVPE